MTAWLKTKLREVPVLWRLANGLLLMWKTSDLTLRSRLRFACGTVGPNAMTELRFRDGHLVTLRGGTTDSRVFRHVFVLRQLEFRDVVDPTVIVDAGANVGITSIFFTKRFPRAKVIAIEPEPANFVMLERNVAGLGNVVAIQAALWWKREPLAIEDPGLGDWGFQVSPAMDGTVPVITMEDLIRTEGRIDVLKLDIEGAEFDLFAHSDEWIDSVDAIAIELHERFRPGVTELFTSKTKSFTTRASQGEVTFVARHDRAAGDRALADRARR
jgi:FkbM family methyltransferase